MSGLIRDQSTLNDFGGKMSEDYKKSWKNTQHVSMNLSNVLFISINRKCAASMNIAFFSRIKDNTVNPLHAG